MKKILLLAALIIGGCTTITQNNGAEIRPVKLEQVSQTSTKADVYNLLGSPSTKSIYGDETWYYITSQIKRKLVRADEVLKQNVVAIKFDTGGHVSDMEVYDINDRRDFATETDISPTAGRELTVMEQLLGNVGKFNPAAGSDTNAIGGHTPNGGRPY